MIELTRYFRLWLKLASQSFMRELLDRWNAGLFLAGKLMRFAFFVAFLLALFADAPIIGGYSKEQMLIFFLTFNILDTATQLFYREVYRFRPMVVSGDFDLVLTKPMSALFRVLAGGADPLDFYMLILYVGLLVYIVIQMGVVSFISVASYLLLLINGFVIATGFHILVLALAIVTTEVDHTIMIYRDLTMMGRVPTDMYHQPIRGILTFALPIGLMMTVPAKALMGLLSPWMLLLSPVLCLLFIVLCLRVWQYALSQYASASS